MTNISILEVMWGVEDIFIDVTEKFKKLYSQSDVIYASGENFGDPVPYKYKVLKVKYIKESREFTEKVFETSFFSIDRKEKIKNKVKTYGITEESFFNYLDIIDNNTDYFEDHIALTIINHTLEAGVVITKRNLYAGFYCYVSYYLIKMNTILNTYKYRLDHIFTRDGFSIYKENENDDLYKIVFKYNEKLDITDFSKKSLMDKYFSPSNAVLEMTETLKQKYHIQPNNCLGIYYRGTDKIKEIKLPPPALFLNKAKTIDVDKILLQTDQIQVAEMFTSYFKEKCIIINELPMSSTDESTYHTQVSNKLKNAIEFNSVLRILAECKELIINPNSSVSQYILSLKSPVHFIT